MVSRGAGKDSVETLLDDEKCGRTVWIKAEEIMTAKGVCQGLISAVLRSGSRRWRDHSPIAKQACRPALQS
jgi:hypothetical protein